MQKAQLNRDKAARLRAEQATARGGVGAPLAGSSYAGTGYTTMGSTAPLGTTMGTAATTHMVAPPIVETHTRPTVIQQTSRPEKIVEVQPVVHREIDQPQVHVVEKHSYEQVRSAGPGVITNQPIVQETIHPRVIEGMFTQPLFVVSSSAELFALHRY